MKKTRPTYVIPDLTEYTDNEGRKWIQTSIDDLFSTRELNDILEKVEKKDDGKEIVVARIDFQKVNREYYEAVIELQKKIQQQNDILKRVIRESRQVIDRKNRKLKELIGYIRHLHSLMESGPEGVPIPAPPATFAEAAGETEAAPAESLIKKAMGRVAIAEPAYEDVTEEVLAQGPSPLS